MAKKPTKSKAVATKAKVKAVATKAKVKAVATKAKSEIVASDHMDMFAQDSNIDNNMGKDDLAIPRINILQALSPAVNKRKAEYIEGAEAGMLVDMVQSKLWDGETGMKVIPVSYRRTYIEWKDRDSGGGFVADHGVDDALLATAERDNKGRLILPNENILVITAEYIVLILEDGAATPAVLSLNSSQLKKSKRWNTLISNLMIPHPKGGRFNPAMFYKSYHLTTVPESNDQGDWFGISIGSDKDVTQIDGGLEFYKQARELLSQLESGAVKVVQESTDGSEDEDDDSPL